MRKVLSFLVIAITIIVACHRKNLPDKVDMRPDIDVAPPPPVEVPPPPPSEVSAPKKVLGFTRTNCMGKCKYYTFTMYSNGSAEYEGKANVTRMGRFYAKMSQEQVAKIQSAASAANVMGLSDGYPTNGKWVTDMPSVMIQYTEKGATKRIRDNYDSPKALQDFEKQVDSLIESLDWHIVD